MSDADTRRRFEVVARETADPVRRYLRRRTDEATADDVLAETLLVLWRRIDRVPSDAAVAWAIGVARLQLSNSERTSRRQDRLVARIIAVDPPPATIVHEGSPVDDDVRAAIAELRPADAEVLRLWAWDDLSPAEIARVLGVSTNAATVRLHRARRRFETQWRKTHPDPGHVPVNEGSDR